VTELARLQKEFPLKLATLIKYAYDNGYELIMADAFRNPKVFGEWGKEQKGYGSMWSVHKLALAQDLELFKNGKWLDKGEEADKGHNFLHDFWDSLGGAERIGHDLNHYSLEYKG